MKPIIYVYTETYYDAKRLFNTLYRPTMDKEKLVSEDAWNSGMGFEIEQETEVWKIFRK